jgi:hypothetical protein
MIQGQSGLSTSARTSRLLIPDKTRAEWKVFRQARKKRMTCISIICPFLFAASQIASIRDEESLSNTVQGVYTPITALHHRKCCAAAMR